MTNTLLTALICLPLLLALLLAFIPKTYEQVFKTTSFVGSLIIFVVSLLLYTGFQNTADMQFVEGPIAWITALGANYYLGIDGISLFLVLLVTFITPIVVLSSYRYIHQHVKEYYILILLMEAVMIGAFVSLNLFLFYIFWEVMLIPMYFLIGVWGSEERIYAAVKFFLFTLVGSLFMLVAIIYLGFVVEAQQGVFSLDLNRVLAITLTHTEEHLLFWAFFIAFAIKVPLVPFHTWLPDAHVQAPTGGSVILAAVLLKMGTYGFLRFLIPLFPHAAVAYAPVLLVISVIGIVYGALLALSQKDIKKLVAYSSVSHLGFVTLGLFSFTLTGMSGGVYQMLNHGISTGALFLLVGVIYERRHTKKIDDFGGIARVMPKFTLIFMMATLASIGLPSTNGFVGEFMILLGTFMSHIPYAKAIVVIASTGVVLGAVYMLWMVERVFFGKITHPENEKLHDLNGREMAVLIPLVIVIFVMGLYTKPFFSKIDPSVNKVIEQLQIDNDDNQEEGR